VPVEPGCQTGGCGMCVTAYVEGDIIHKDTCLSVSDRERYFCPCVSRGEDADRPGPIRHRLSTGGSGVAGKG
jgi:hypothetical protein